MDRTAERLLRAVRLEGPDADGFLWLRVDWGTGKAAISIRASNDNGPTIVAQTVKLWDEDRRALLALLPPSSAEGNHFEWPHGCDAILQTITLWVPRCPHCGRPRPSASVAPGSGG